MHSASTRLNGKIPSFIKNQEASVAFEFMSTSRRTSASDFIQDSDISTSSQRNSDLYNFEQDRHCLQAGNVAIGRCEWNTSILLALTFTSLPSANPMKQPPDGRPDERR